MSQSPPFWDGVLRRLSAELPAFAVDAWVRPLAPEADGEGLRLRCPSALHRARVGERYLERIAACAASELGRPVPVRLVVAPPECGADRVAGALPAGAPGELPGAAPQPPAPSCGAPTAGPEGRSISVPAGGSEATAAAHASRAAAPFPPRLAPSCAEGPAAEPAPGGAISAAPAGGAPAPRPRVPAPSPASRPAATAPRQWSLPHTFETFVVGRCNALAREAALAVAHGREPNVSPLYLVSPPGLGKTHLARAVVTEAARRAGVRAVLLSAEQFMNEFLSAIRARRTTEFKQRLRSRCDLLVLDDVQFLANKESTQLELFHTLEHLRAVGAGIVVTGDRLPRDITGLEHGLESRLASGLVAAIEPPDATVRRNILRSKAAAGGVRLPHDCLERLVEVVRGSVRELESALIQVVASASLLKRPIDLELTEAALSRILPAPRESRPLEPGEVVRVVAGFFGTTPEALAARSRRRDVLVPRQIAMYLCRRYTDASLKEIGRAFGRNHPSVSNAVAAIERAMLERAPLRYQVEAITDRLHGRGSERR